MNLDKDKFYFINDNIIFKMCNESTAYIYGYNILQDEESMIMLKKSDVKKYFEVTDSIFSLLRNERAQFLLARNYTKTTLDISNILGVHERTAIRFSHKYDIKRTRKN